VIAANKNDVIDAFLYVYFRWLARRAFHTIAGRGLERLNNCPTTAGHPLLQPHELVGRPGHLLLTRQMKHKAVYCMMEKSSSSIPLLHVARGVLGRPEQSAAGRVVAAVCQRLLQKNDTRSGFFRRAASAAERAGGDQAGHDYLAQSSPHALLVPVAMRFDFFREDRPNALVEVGQPFHAIDSAEGRIAQECNEAFARVTKAHRTRT